jgi:hypothetical protein
MMVIGTDRAGKVRADPQKDLTTMDRSGHPHVDKQQRLAVVV